MGSRELGGSSPHSSKRESTPFGAVESPSMKERGEQGDAAFGKSKFPKDFEKESEKRKPKSATGGGGDKPPIDRSSSHAGAEFPDQGPKRDLEGIMHYFVGNQDARDLMEAALAEEGVVSLGTFPEEKESLAEFDPSSTVKGRLEFDQGLVKTQYHETLNRSGLKFTNDVFSPELLVVDGQRFKDTLSAIPEGSETLNTGLEEVAKNFFITIRNGHLVPPYKDAEYHKHPSLLPYITEREANLKEYKQVTTEMLKHGDTIAEQLERLGVKDTTVIRLKTAHTANQEGMLPEWAIADNMDLYKSPTHHFMDRYWTHFGPDDWQRLHEFLDSAVAKAPKDSKFIGELARTMQTNIHKVRNGILTPSEGGLLGFEDKTAQEYLQQYDEDLLSTEQKLQNFIQGGNYEQ